MVARLGARYRPPLSMRRPGGHTLECWATWGTGLRAVALIIAALSLCATAAGAQDSGPRVSLVVLHDASAISCVESRELRDQVAARLGRDPFVEGAADQQVVVRFSSVRRRFSADVIVSGGGGEIEGERTLSDRDCGDLVEATALLLSLLFEPDDAPAPSTVETTESRAESATALEQVPGGSQQVPTPTAAPVTDAAIEVPVAAEPPTDGDPVEASSVADVVPAAHLRLFALASAGVLFGWVPGSTFALRVGVGVGEGAWSVRIEGRTGLDSVARDERGVGAQMSWSGASLSGCGHLDLLALCGHAVLARSAGVGLGVDAPRRDEALVVGVGASVAVGWAPWPWLRLELEAELDVPVLTPVAEVNGAHVWQATPVAALLTGGAALGFEP